MFLNTDKVLLYLWFVILLLFFIVPMVKRYLKVKRFNCGDEYMDGQASWMAAPITMKYPGSARQKKIEGSVIVEIEFNKSCDYVGAKLLQSSGSQALDESVLTAVAAAKLLPNKELVQQWKVTFKLEVPSVMPQL